ncbi:hypothetical protein HZU38_05410 [Mycolicibacterium vanbaalenii]|uniref:hypothetical protein n=1 Tax=Mycolicibacterium vanbaalenii TaxID=110539 RepID=UPI001F32074F|nr:hypothetical protein [Mycolicibacterium vanbaalenii]UJL29939.1 hypothetical protein HZU38_05410 [Mycolicibacterium vanbaalenii]WND56999.1 hypothetical protein QQA43_00855 [Mycolicibacterium vanbaalenii]
MAHLKVDVDQVTIFDGEVEDWNPTPNMPELDHGAGFANLPSDVQEALALAMAKTLEKLIGRRVKVYL